MSKKQDVVNHPSHYKGVNGLEAIEVIEGFGLGFHLGNVVKYVLRAGRKAGPDYTQRLEVELQDLKKARWYLDREVRRTERGIGNMRAIDRLTEAHNRKIERKRKR